MMITRPTAIKLEGVIWITIGVMYIFINVVDIIPGVELDNIRYLSWILVGSLAVVFSCSEKWLPVVVGLMGLLVSERVGAQVIVILDNMTTGKPITVQLFNTVIWLGIYLGTLFASALPTRKEHTK